MNFKQVYSLGNNDREELNQLVKDDKSARVRMRAEAILLSANGYSIKQISQIKGKCIITVSRWIDQWEERGIDGILEGEGRGRKDILSEDERREILEWMGEKLPPRNATELVGRIMKAFGKAVGEDTVRRLLKQSGKVWKRVRCGLAGKRDEDSFRQCEQELAEHLQASGRGEIRLLYLDESGFNDAPHISSAWQDIRDHAGVALPQRQAHQRIGNPVGVRGNA